MGRWGSVFLYTYVILLFIGLGSIQAQEFPIYLEKGKSTSDYGLFSTQEYKTKTLNRVNYHRGLAGLLPVSLNEKLSQAAQAHAEYLNLNNYAGHDEEQGKPGFVGQWAKDRATSFGYDWASVGEVISFGLDAEEGVDSLIMAIYHRFIILNPTFVEVGIGDSQHPTYGMVQVIVFGREKGVTSPPGYIGVYPSDGQKEVPTKFNSDSEWPDPVPEKGIVGYPVSIHFSSDFTISNVEFSIMANSQAIDVSPVKSSESNPKGYAAVPMEKLSPNTSYQAWFSATINGQPYQKTWTFDTVVSDSLKAEPSMLTILVGSSAIITLTNYGSTINWSWGNSSVINVGKAGKGKLEVQGLSVGSTTITIGDDQGQVATVYVWVVLPESFDLGLKSGWNLLSSLVGIDLTKSMTSSGITSIWKWKNNNWEVRLPSYGDKGEAYAASKGFGFLIGIEPGEGFWVNSQAEENITVQGLKGSGGLQIKIGWNLLGLKKAAEYATQDLIKASPENITSLWKWINGTWAVYLPGEADKGKGYADAKGFSFLDNVKTGEGFWVNAKQDLVLQ